MTSSRRRSVLVKGGMVASLAGLALGAPALGQAPGQGGVPVEGVRAAGSTRLAQLAASLGGPVSVLRATPRGGSQTAGGSAAGLADGCEVTRDYTTFNWSSPLGANVSAQAGFAQGEIQAVSYQIPAGQFPLKINTVETLLAGNTTVQTTTRWTVQIYDGPPSTGLLVAQFSSDGEILPHLVLQAGTGTAGIIQFGVDPGDPEQIILTNQSGTGVVSIAFRIDGLNAPSPNPCTTGAQASANVFPTTDRDGLSQAGNNWLFGLNCGALGCPPNGGWAAFSQLTTGLFGCRPSGDWVMRLTYTPANCTPGLGACCLPTGSCELLGPGPCQTAGGVYQGDGTSCSGTGCPQPTGACCFGNGCLVLTSADCALASGVYQGNGTTCAAGGACPQGACCLPSGSCIITSSSGCAQLSGTYRGANTACATANCPQPTGACCFASGGCLSLTQSNCQTAQGTWRGSGVACAAGGSCPPPASCYANCDGSTFFPTLNALDFGCFLQQYQAGVALPGSAQVSAYANCDGSTIVPAVNAADFACFLQRYRTPEGGTNCTR